MKTSTLILSAALLTTTIISCTKRDSCFDAELFRKHKDIPCTMDCPGVKGCDGKSYCNECIANSQGISVD